MWGYVSDVTRLVKGSSLVKHRAVATVYYGYLVLFAARLLVTALSLQYHSEFYFHYDLLIGTFISNTKFDHISYYFAALLTIYGIVPHYLLYYHCDSTLWTKYFADLVLENLRQMPIKEPRIRFEVDYDSLIALRCHLESPYYSWLALNKTVICIWSFPRLTLRSDRGRSLWNLSHFPNLPPEVRFKLAMAIYSFNIYYKLIVFAAGELFYFN